MTPDLKADLLEMLPYAIRDMRSGNRHNDADRLAALRARLQAATVTEPVAFKEGKNPKWPRAVVNNALDLLEIRALNAGDVALAQHARQVLEEMSDPAPQAPPPDPCVVECGGVSTERVRGDKHLALQDAYSVSQGRFLVDRTEAAALIPALQAFVAEGGR